MTKRHLAVLLLLLPVANASQTPNQQLELHAEIKSERYCEVDDEISSLLVIFKIRLVNNGNVPVVVVRRPYPLLLVSRTLPNLKRGKHEFELHEPESFGPPTTKPEQRVVRQGEVFESETVETIIPTPKTTKYSKREALAPGTHYVQAVVTVQVEGALKFADAVSQPIEITILKYPKTENCERDQAPKQGF